MANGKYTFQDMKAEKSNAQDLLDIYLRNKNPVPVGGSFDWMAHQNQSADYTNKIDQHFNPTPAPTRSQLIEQGIPLGQRKAIEAAAAAELAKSVQETRQATIRDQFGSGGTGPAPQPRGRTQATPTSATPAFDPEAARMMMNFPANASTFEQTQVVQPPPQTQRPVTGPAPTIPDLDWAAIQQAIQDAATGDTAPTVTGDPLSPFGEGLDSRGRAIGDYDFGDGKKGLGGGDPDAIKFLESWNADVLEGLDLAGLDSTAAAEVYETASAQRALDQGFINQDVFNALEVQIATDEGGNIDAPIFDWGVTESGADQIVMAPTTVDPAEQCTLDGGTWNGTSCDFGDGEVKTAEQLCIDQGGTWDGTSCKIGGDPQITVPPEEELTYEDKQKQLSTDTYNDRVTAIQAAVKAGNIDIDDAQTAFNDAKNELFAQMAELNKITYDEVDDTFSFNTQQRATDVQSMLDLLAGQGVEQNLIQDVIGGDIGMNLAGYGEGTDAMRDFSEMLNIIGQQGSSEAGMLGNYMFDSYRQDLDTTGRNMELQSAMQMLAEQQAASEQNLQSSMLGPYFGLDPALMMAGMGAGIDVAGVSENRAVREQAAEDAMAMLLAQQAFQTGEREAGQTFQTGERTGAETFTGGQNYQNNVWDYLTDQTMNPYQSGMLGVAQQGQQMDTLSTLMDLMNPQPTAADNAAFAAQAQTNALDSALSKMQMGSIPAQDPIFKQGQMMAGTPAFNWQNNLTGEEVQALDAVGWDTEGLLYGDMQEQMNSMNEISNMGSFADVMQVPLEVLMGAEALGAGVVGALVDDIIAGGNDPMVNYTHPAMEGFEPWAESIPLSQATALYDYEYQAGEPAPFNLFGYDVGEDGLLDTDRVMDLMELGYTMEEIEEALLGL